MSDCVCTMLLLCQTGNITLNFLTINSTTMVALNAWVWAYRPCRIYADSVSIIIIIIMGWRACPRHSARQNDRPHADMLDDLSGGANPRGDDWWKLAVRVHGLQPVLLRQYGQTALAVATLQGKWPAVDLFWSGPPDWWHVSWIGCAGYIAGTTGRRPQDVVWMLQSVSHTPCVGSIEK